MTNLKYGFPPVFDSKSKILILGSFPSVKSREINFYYGNKQNRFWRTVCSLYKEEIPESIEGKKEFLLRHNIALWDIAASCEVKGSADSSIKNCSVADLNVILKAAAISLIIFNGATAGKIALKAYPALSVPYKILPSTSPANPSFSFKAWEEAFLPFIKEES